MKKQLPFILIIASITLILFNVITTAAFDKSFWMSILSSVLIIISMALTIRDRNKTE